MKTMNLFQGDARPHTTLFMLMSVDGKISTGSTEEFDFDIDLPELPYTSEGLQQYYDLEKETDLWTLCSAKTQNKVLKNVNLDRIERIPVNLVMVGGHSISRELVEKVSRRFEKVVLGSYCPLSMGKLPENASLTYCNGAGDGGNLTAFLTFLRKEHGVERLTIQGGGNLNQMFLRDGLIDELNLVVAPLLVGGYTVPCLLSGQNPPALSALRGLQLISATELKAGYLQLRYCVLN